MGLGVPEGKLIMVDYDPAWKKYGEDMVNTLKEVMTNAVDIRHVGSSAVEGMYGKPMIDVAVGVRELDDVLEYVDELEKRGIHYVGEYLKDHREFYMNDPETGYKAYHIHCVIYNETFWKRYTYITEYLQEFSNARDAYSYVKKGLELVYADRPDHYGPAKKYFVDDIMLAAFDWKGDILLGEY